MTEPLKITPALIAFHVQRAHDLRAAEIRARFAAAWNFIVHRRKPAARCEAF